MTRRSRALLALSLAAVTALAACSPGSDSESGDSGSTPAPSSAASPSATATPPGQALARLGVQAVAAEYTATYTLDRPGGDRPDATVTMHRRGLAYRLDVARAGARSVLLTARQGLVACQLGEGRRVCLLVARRGERLPRLFDPGLQRLFTTAPRAFASGRGLTVTETGVLPAGEALPAARCFQVSGRQLDGGEYCLTETGVLRRAQFQSATLELTGLAGPPDDADFVPPEKPRPLPS